jgi:hypothetical protein
MTASNPYHIVYVSVATRPLARQELLALLSRSRDHNQRAAITGMLLHKADRFAQVLEGEETAVRRLYDTISRDDRHQRVAILEQGPVAHRDFPDWSMGFQDLNDADLLGLYGTTRPLGKALDIEAFRSDPAACLHALRFVRDLQLTRS